MAVEFVHPVIMGKRALPAFALTDQDVVGQARRRGRQNPVTSTATGWYPS